MEKKPCNPNIPIYFLRYMIEKRRHELAESFNMSNHLQSPTIIQLSQELDELLNQYMVGIKKHHEDNDEA
ncbi:MAG: aspartyl-phosphate phosphatase Spo0E family protein [Bacillota bacterium]